MLRFTHRKRPNIPLPDYNDPKELYAFYGLAGYCAQLLEQGITNLLVGLSILGKQKPTYEDVLSLFDNASSKPMGCLLKAARAIIPFSSELEQQLFEAKKQRNYLVHHFFVEHDKDLLSDSGRKQMLDELIVIIGIFKNVDLQVDNLWLEIWGKYGWSEDRILKELELIKQRLEQ